jgi:hypothetical protein
MFSVGPYAIVAPVLPIVDVHLRLNSISDTSSVVQNTLIDLSHTCYNRWSLRKTMIALL